MKPTLRSKALLKVVIPVGVLAAVAVIVYAQTPLRYTMPDFKHMKVSPERDDLWFQTKVGSFRILPRGDVKPSGTLTMKFTGSVLVSELNGTVLPSGNVRKEYDNKAKGKQIWFGTGSLKIDGSFSAVQWFGRDLDAHFYGNGFFRLYGEFDKKLDTGLFWFDPAKKEYWGTYGVGFGVPQVKFGPANSDAVKTRQEPEKPKQGSGGN